ncbi:MAG: hypothetical protein GX783_01045 [Clostridiales bacterium]|nr:hypothetical protein [Clostridiales bacterium]
MISANPSKKNQTQGGVYTITNNNPKTINIMDSRLGFLLGMQGLYAGLHGLWGFLRFQNQINI